MFISVVLGLLCHCDICADRNFTCVTDGYCFTSTSLQKDTGVITRAYRCVIVILPLLRVIRVILFCENMINIESMTVIMDAGTKIKINYSVFLMQSTAHVI
jgi:TGF-beta receptor type-1